MAKTGLEKEIKKLWEILKDSPEKGHSVGDLQNFTSEIKNKLEDNGWSDEDGWAYRMSEIRKSYGVGPSAPNATGVPSVPVKSEDGNAYAWWQKEETHLSKDGKYYIVPLVFEDINKNVHLVEHKIAGKYKIGETGEPNTLLGSEKFTNNCKKWALKKLKRNLNKAIANNQIEPWSKMYGFIPKNKQTADGSGVQAWHILPRQPNYQALWIKVMFDKSWVDALPAETDPNVDYSTVTKEVLIHIKDLKNYLLNLETILRHFDAQMQLAFAQDGVEVSFSATCIIESISSIYETLDALMVANKKGNLSNLSETGGALQLGFTSDLALVYVAYSDMPDCLCDENENMNSFNLRTSLDTVKSRTAFSNPTVNNFIHQLPAINRRYSRYLQSTKKVSGDLFSTEKSWLNFVNTYVYPRPEVVYHGEGSESHAAAWMATLGTIESLGNPFFKNMLLSGKYIQDPVAGTFSPEMKNMIASASNVTNIDTSDDNMLAALLAEVKSIDSLYTNIMNRIPIGELLKIAGPMLFKCLGSSDVKKALCQSTLKSLPISEIRQQLYPCLRDLGAPGELAIAKLEEKITGQTNLVYDIAAARYPDKFSTSSDPASQARALSQMTTLYCSDPWMQRKLGRSPDDFSDELAKWADEMADDAICDCILTLHDPISQFVDVLQDVSDEWIDGALSPSRDNAHDLDKDTTLAIDRMIVPIKKYLTSRDGLKDFGNQFGQAIQDMAMNIIYAAVLVLLKYVKEEWFGSFSKDVCNKSQEDSGFSNESLETWLKKSPLYENDSGPKIEDMFEKMKGKHLFSQDIKSMIESFNKVSEICSPNELKRVFTTDCGDDSMDATYETIAYTMMGAEAKKQLIKDFPGESLSSIVAIVGYVPGKKGQETVPDPETGENVPYKMPAGFISPGQAHDLCSDVGSTIDVNLFDENIQAFEDRAKEALRSLCEPGALGELAKTIDEKDIIDLAKGEKDDLIKEIESILPLVDKQKMENMYPPIFCGPCAPNQVGMKPMMSSQSHPTQLFMQQRLNDSTYKLIDDVFNNNLSVYKSIITEDGNASVIDKLLGELPTGKVTAADAKNQYDKAIEKMLTDFSAEQNNDDNKNKLVANKFREKILQITESSYGNLGQLKNFDPENKVAEFSYDIPDTPYVIWMVFNFSDQAYTFKGVPIGSPQIKLLCFSDDTLEYAYPEGNEFIKDFNFDDVGDEMFEYFFNPSGKQGKIVSALMGLSELVESGKARELFKSLFPIASNLIMETVWNNVRQNELFKTENFLSLPLTNTEATDKCADTNSTPILDVEKNKQDVEDFRKSLECVISMFATPDAMQIANLFGLYKLLMKVCIVEEFLKNIFMFTFAKVSDVIEDPAYMNFVKINIRNTIESILSTGYDNLLEYSEKVVNSRLKLADPSDEDFSDPDKLQQLKMKSPEECLDILIIEAALEVDGILDSRVREHIDKTWKNKFIKIKDLEAGGTAYLKNNFLQYAISENLMEDPRYPARKYTQGGVNNNGPEAKLTTAQLPSFESVDYNTKSDGPGPDYYNPLPGSEGGLFYEPFVRMNSKLSYDISSEFDELEFTLKSQDPQGPKAQQISSAQTEYYLQTFWKKFKQAFYMWEKTIFRDKEDVNIQAPVDNPGSPHQGHIFNWGNSGNLFSKYIESMEEFELPKNQRPFSTNRDDAEKQASRIHKFIKNKIINPIDQQLENQGVLAFHTGGTYSKFYDFFLLFFCPLHANGRPHELLDINISKKFGLRTTGAGKVNYRSVFENVVSSFVHDDAKGSEFDQKYADDGSKSFVNIAGTKGSNITRSLDAFYYWQHYPEGITPASRPHFRNRGIIGISSFTTSIPPAYARKSFYKWNGSTINVFAAAKETNIGADEISPASATLYNTDFMNSIKEFMKLRGYEHFKSEKQISSLGQNPSEEDVAQLNQENTQINAPDVFQFYSWMKSIITEAPFDHWFDMSLGMRLNLIIPFESSEQDSPLSQEYIKNLVKTFTNLSDFDIFNDREYNLDKVFLLSSPGPGDELNLPSKKKWLCIPIEAVEYDLYDYWSELYTNLFTNYTIPAKIEVTSPVVKEFIAFKESTADLPKNNPWNIIMGEINNLGLGRGAKGGLEAVLAETYKFSYASGNNHNGLWNLYNNLYVPFVLWSHHMQPGAAASTYYKRHGSTGPARPTLWATCKLINTFLCSQVPDYTTQTLKENDLKVEVINELKKQLLTKVTTGDSKILSEILPVRESIFSTALMYRFSMLSAYPNLENLFSPTKSLISSFITQSLATFDGDYTYVNEAIKETNQEEKLNTSSPAPPDVAGIFFRLIIQMAANMVDPTWKTPWLLPGPLTPVGILAKSLPDMKEAKTKEELKGKIGEKEECDDK